MKEKAIELIESFHFTNYHGQTPEYAQRCALVVVDEYLSLHEHLFITEGSAAYYYWLGVKTEILKYNV